MDLHEPWLVAVWPGMGRVALGAGGYLIEKLDVEFLAELPPGQHFDLERVEIKRGIVVPGRLPRSRFYGWKNPNGGRDLVIFVGEAQPNSRSYDFCGGLLRVARSFGITRVLTFAAMVTSAHPSADSRVFAIATSRPLLAEVGRLRQGLPTLERGEITGLNGTLLAAAAEQGLAGVGLLGELPQIATNVPYLKASGAVLDLFCEMGGVELDLGDLHKRAASIEKGLIDIVDRLQNLVKSKGDSEPPPSWLPQEIDTSDTGEIDELEHDDDDEPESRIAQLSPEELARIEALFQDASADREKALELKQELDRCGVFKDFEDRFLDLFAG